MCVYSSVTSKPTGGDDDLEKAIALSLKESQSKAQPSLYPSMPVVNNTGYTFPSTNNSTSKQPGAPSQAKFQVSLQVVCS